MQKKEYMSEIVARRREMFDEIRKMFIGSLLEPHLAIEDEIFVNARNKHDPEMQQIKKTLIKQAKIQPTWGQKMPKCFLPLELECEALVRKGIPLITIDNMKTINSNQAIRPLSDTELKVFLKIQHSIGKILFFDEPGLDKHIILSPTHLIDAFKSIVTDKMFCEGEKKKKETWDLMATKGIIPKKAVREIWKNRKYAHFQKSADHYLGVMTHLDILVEPRRYDSSHKRVPPDFFYVASMVRKLDNSGYLESPSFKRRSIALSFDTTGLVIPPALSFRFISYCLSVWGVRTYGKTKEDMLFHRSAVFILDPSLDLHILCKDDFLVVRLIHARDRTLIMRDMASSIRECLISALQKISQLYINTSSGQEGSVRMFNMKVCCSCPTDPCFLMMNDLGDVNDVWICPRHQIEHRKDTLTSWFTEKDRPTCESSCPVTNEDFLEQSPTDLHLRKLSLEYDMTEVREIVTALHLPYREWDDLYTSTMTNETIRFSALQKCHQMTIFTYRDLKKATQDLNIENPHRICKVLRDSHIDFESDPEKWDIVPTDEDIDKLAPLVGNRSLQFLVELGLTFQDWEQIEYRHTRERDLVKLNRDILEAWKENCKKYHMKPSLRYIGQAFGNIGTNTKNIENILFD